MNDKLVNAEMQFGGGALSKPRNFDPNMSVTDLTNLGVRFFESETLRMVEVPFLAQKTLADIATRQGFGAARALQIMIEEIIKLAGLTVGRVQTKVDQKTFSWTAYIHK